MTVRYVQTCRYCGSRALHDVLSLGEQPPSNSFLRPDEIASERRYPLDLTLCTKCYLVQLRHAIAPSLIFDRYLYLSSSSAALREHYTVLADEIERTCDLEDGDLVVDVGCNDGILLARFDARFRRVGVEPSQVAEIARSAGLDVVRAYFGRDVARQLMSSHGPAKVVTATNVFPHVDAIDDFVEAIRELLGTSGTFVIEASYLPDLIDRCLFDTIYHEHLCYLSITALVPFLRGHGLVVTNAIREPLGASGPAIRVYARPTRAGIAPAASVERLLEEEARWGIRDLAVYQRFAERVTAVRTELLGIITDFRGAGRRVGAYGAPAKGNTLLNFVGLGPDLIEMVSETNPLKQGLLTPGTHIPIVSEEDFLASMPPYALLLTWNYLEHFLAHSEYIRRGGKFIVPLPTPTIAPAA